MPFSQQPKVAVVMGSDSDLPVLEGCFDLLDQFGIHWTGRVMSAHRTPHAAAEFAAGAKANGIEVIICAAGMSAHLAGVMSAHTTLPVLGIPVACEPFNGFDALLSTVNMPPGVPVATMSAGKAGARNAAVFAASIIALADKTLAGKLADFKKSQADKVESADRALSAKLASRGG